MYIQNQRHGWQCVLCNIAHSHNTGLRTLLEKLHSAINQSIAPNLPHVAQAISSINISIPRQDVQKDLFILLRTLMKHNCSPDGRMHSWIGNYGIQYHKHKEGYDYGMTCIYGYPAK